MAILVYTQMAGFQLAGPAADVSKILYGESRNRTRAQTRSTITSVC